MSETTRQHQHLFIVRLWQETSRLASDQWRGSIEHVPSTQRIYFTSLADLTDFITWRLSSPLPSSAVEVQALEDQYGEDERVVW